MEILGFIINVVGWFLIFDAVDNQSKLQAFFGGLIISFASIIIWVN